MLTEMLTEGLEQYRIGPKIRDLRQNKNLGLVQLGEHTGLSTSMLSKIERGLLFPTLPTLLRIAVVFGVGLEYFFVESDKRPIATVVRKKDRLRLPDRPDDVSPAYFFESLDFPATDRRMAAYYAEFPAPSKPVALHSHEGAEFIYMLSGQLAIEVAGETTILQEGDAMYFDSSTPHSYRRHGRAACAAIVVVAPAA